MRLIDADELKSVRSIQAADFNRIESIQRWIDNAPTIDPVKRGKWLRTPTGWAYCSVCGMEPPNESNETTDFCPNCGARMDGE